MHFHIDHLSVRNLAIVFVVSLVWHSGDKLVGFLAPEPKTPHRPTEVAENKPGRGLPDFGLSYYDEYFTPSAQPKRQKRSGNGAIDLGGSGFGDSLVYAWGTGGTESLLYSWGTRGDASPSDNTKPFVGG